MLQSITPAGAHAFGTSHLKPAQPFAALPFVADLRQGRRTRRVFWSVPPTDDYAQACAAGRQYACALVQQLLDEPGWAGSNVLGHMVRDMDAAAGGSGAAGYQVGFWSTLEVLLVRAARRESPWAVARALQQRYDAINRAREAEDQREAP